MKRRNFILNTLLGLGGAPLAAPLASGVNIPGKLFSLGIASGDVTDSSAVLWTRLAPEPLEADGGMAAVTVPVHWQLSTDPGMTRVVQQGEALASPGLAHSVHVNLQGLSPGQEYWYQFSVAGQSSPVGRTRTLPAHNSEPESLRFATASCQNYTHGYFVAYEHMIKDRPDFVIHLGDYFYDTAFGATFRRHETEKPPQTLDEFRRRHALYKTDRHLQQAHAQLPFFTMIDNHDAIEDMDPDKFAQRTAAYQAWYEHMPVRGYAGPGQNHFELHRLIRLGSLAQIALLDGRQFRDKKDLCRDSMDPDYGFGNYREQCDAILEEGRSMLGAEQERWLEASIRANQSSWNVIASPGPVLPFRYHVNNSEKVYIGAWDAYPSNRKRLARAINSAQTGHPLILSGDVHSFWALDGSLVKNPDASLPVVEFVSSSISANWPEPLAKPVSDNLSHNPQVAFYEPARRGYLLHEINKAEWKTTARAVEDAKNENSGAFNLASFLVRNGETGLIRLPLP